MVGENPITHVDSEDVDVLSPEEWKKIQYDLGKQTIDRYVTSIEGNSDEDAAPEEVDVANTAEVDTGEDGGNTDKAGSETDADKDKTDITGEMEMRKAVERLRDRYGNEISPESVSNLFKLAREDPEAFAREYFELMRGSRSDGAEQGYAKAQSEIGEILKGRDIGKFLQEQGKLIDELREERDAEKTRILAQIEKLPESERAEVEARLSDERLVDLEMAVEEAEWQYDIIKELQLGYGGFESATSEPDGGEDKTKESANAEKGEVESRKGFEIEALDPLSEVYNIQAQKRRADIVAAMRYFSEDSRGAVLEQLAKVEAEERKIKEEAMNEFAASDDSEGSDDDVAAAAAVAGESSFRETTDEDEAERSKKYREEMSKMADEAKPGRFDKFEEQTQRAQETSGQEETANENYEWINKDYYNKLKSWAEDEAKSPIKNRFGDPEIVDKKARPRRLEKIRNKNEYIADDEYYNKMQGWANDELDSPVENRFGDYSESAKSEREKRAGGLWSRLKGRIWRSGSKGEVNDGNNMVDEEAEDTESLANEPKIKPDYTGLGGVLDELLKNSEQGDSSADGDDGSGSETSGSSDGENSEESGIDTGEDNELNLRNSKIEALQRRLADIEELDTDVFWLGMPDMGNNHDKFIQGKTFDDYYDKIHYISELLNEKNKQLAEARRGYDAELRGLLSGKSPEEFLQELQQVIDKLNDIFYKERTKEVELFNSLPMEERTDDRWELESQRSREIEDQIRRERWLLEQVEDLELNGRAE